MAFFRSLGHMRPLSRYILTRGILLSCAMLACALVMLVWAGEYRYDTVLIYAYAQYTQDMALIVLGTGLIGSILLEDVLIHTDT